MARVHKRLLKASKALDVNIGALAFTPRLYLSNLFMMSALNFIDDLIRLRASESQQKPIIYCPREKSSVVYYETLNAKNNDILNDNAAQVLVSRGLKSQVSGHS